MAVEGVTSHSLSGVPDFGDGAHEQPRFRDERRAATAERWRRQVLTAEALPAFGPIQLQRFLRLLAGRSAMPPNALPRLYQLCSAGQPADERHLLRVLPPLATWWAGLEGARFLVAARLRSPYGGPTQTFEALERMLQTALTPATSAAPTAPGGVAASMSASSDIDARRRTRLRLLLHTLEQLESHVTNAYDGEPPSPIATGRGGTPSVTL